MEDRYLLQTKKMGIKQLKSRLFIIICLLAILAIILSCSNIRSQSKYAIGFSQCCSDPWRNVMEGEMYRELAFYPEIGFEIRKAEGNSNRQIEQIRELVELGVDLLIVAPNESEPLTAVIEEVYSKKIPVILIDRKTESESYTAYVGGDNYFIGKTAANYIANKFNRKGKIIELQMAKSVSAAIERNRGFMDGLDAYPNMEVIEAVETELIAENVYNELPTVLNRHPEIDIIFAHTDMLAELAYEVAKSQNRAEDIFFVGVDGIPGNGNGIQSVEEGVLDASLLYPTGGAEAIQLALTILHRLPFEKKNLLETTVIDPSNARIIHLQMEKVNNLQKTIDEQISQNAKLNQIFRNQRLFIVILTSSLLVALILGAFLWRSLQTRKKINRNLENKNREVLKQQEQILAMSNEVSAATKAKVDFFTNISHEFRTPLTLILGFAEDLIPSKELSNQVKKSIQLISENGFRLLRLVNQLMDFRKIESNKMRILVQEKDLIAFIENIMKSYRQVAKKRNIDFQLYSRHESLKLFFDGSMMDKVFFNLLSNAFKFTPNGGKIHLFVQKDEFENLVKIMVEDSGAGMSKEVLQHIFEPFYQGSSEPNPGTGLGLPLSQRLIDLHGGTLTVNSIPDKGSRFTVTLFLGSNHFNPDQISTKSESFLSQEFLFLPEIQNKEEAPQIIHTVIDQPKLLLIEDNPDLQFFLRKKLGEEYMLTQATEGNVGIQMAFEQIPDLIICDIMLPDANGIEITKHLKSDLRTSHIPVILLTAQSTIEQQIEGTRVGADAYIIKPFNARLLQEKIKNLLHNRQILKESFGQDIVAINQQTAISSIDQKFLNHFISYIKSNYSRQDFQVTDLCEEMGLSRSQLYRKIKALLGLSISEYIQNIRLEKAEKLLIKGELTIAEVAYQVGYTSPDYFSTLFKSRYNLVPSQFRKDRMKEKQ